MTSDTKHQSRQQKIIATEPGSTGLKGLSRLSYLLTYVWRSYGDFRAANVKLFLLMILAAALEGVGLAMFVPLMQLLTGQSDGLVLSLISPFLATFPEKYYAIIVAAVLLGLLIFKHLSLLLAAGYSTHVTMGLRDMWRNRIMTYYLFSRDRFAQNSRQGELMENIIQQPRNAAKLARYVINLMREFIFAVAMCTILFLTSAPLTLIIFGALGGAVLISHGPLKRYANKVGRRMLKLQQKTSDTAAENIVGLREIKLMSLERKRVNQFHDYSRQEAKLAVWQSVVDGLPLLVTTVMISILLLGGVALATLIRPGSFEGTFPIAALFILVGSRLNNYVTALIRYSVQIQMAGPAFRLVTELAAKQNFEVPSEGLEFSKLETDIVFKDVSFSYNGVNTVIDNFSMTIPLGKWTALVGPSGMGKSTIVQLLTGEISPSSGTIAVNGHLLGEFSMTSWRHRLGVVSQEAFLFNTTVRDNIALARPGVSDMEIVEAAKLASAHDFILALEDGYDTIVGDRGSKLSGGERQRVAIARAIVGGSELYVFDEATNAQDTSSQKVILDTMQQLRQSGKTVLMISHQSNVLESVDVVHQMKRVNSRKTSRKKNNASPVSS